MTDYGKIGVVTITFNSATLLEDFLASLEGQTHSAWHAYIIDNDSKDGTVESLRQRRLDVCRYSVVPNAKNVGVAAGNNQGIVMALDDGCEWVLLVNNDTIFPPKLLAVLEESCAKQQWRVAVPKIHFNVPANTIWYGGGGFDPKKGYTGFHAGIEEVDEGQFDQLGTVDYSPTCCMLIHRSVFERVGLMDESYFAYFDDTDFCWRLKAAGIAIGYIPDVTLVHKVGGSTGGTASPFFARMTARNRLYFLRKHFGRWAPIRWLGVFLPYYVYRYLLKSWNPEAFKASIQGTMAYARMKEHTPLFTNRRNQETHRE